MEISCQSFSLVTGHGGVVRSLTRCFLYAMMTNVRCSTSTTEPNCMEPDQRNNCGYFHCFIPFKEALLHRHRSRTSRSRLFKRWIHMDNCAPTTSECLAPGRRSKRVLRHCKFRCYNYIFLYLGWRARPSNSRKRYLAESRYNFR